MVNDPSKEYEVSDLLREIEGLREENAILRAGFSRIYNATAAAYSAKGKDEKKTAERDARTVGKFDTLEDRTGYLATRAEVYIEALSEPPAVAARTTEAPDPLRYDLRNLNQRRAEALAAHLRQTGKSSIKSTEARAFLEGVEGRALDRKAVWRALRAAQGILRAARDIIGGIARLILPPSTSSPRGSPQEGGSQPIETPGYGGNVPRPRRWPVAWEGED